MTNAECREAINDIYLAIGRRVKYVTFQWLASGLAGVVLLLFAFTYNTGCTANKGLARTESNAQLFAAHYVGISGQIKELKAEIASMRKENRNLTKILYEREGVMIPPHGEALNPPIGFTD